MDDIARKKHIETVREQLSRLMSMVRELYEIGAINHDEWEVIELPLDESDAQLEIAMHRRGVSWGTSACSTQKGSKIMKIDFECSSTTLGTPTQRTNALWGFGLVSLEFGIALLGGVAGLAIYIGLVCMAVAFTNALNIALESHNKASGDDIKNDIFHGM
jgi:hypothetical protein